MSDDDLIRRGDALQMLREANGLSDAADDINDLPAVRRGMKSETGICRNCDGAGWVCENHRDMPWPDGCECSAGAPCPICEWEAATAGVIGTALWPNELRAEADRREQASSGTAIPAAEPAEDVRAGALAHALDACRIIDEVVKEGHDNVGKMILHFMEAVEPARAALALIPGAKP